MWSSTWCWVLIATTLRLPPPRVQGSFPRAPRNDFARHRLFIPKLHHRKEREEEIQSTLGQDGRHVQHLTITFDVDGRLYVLDLVLNTYLIPDTYFEKYQHNDGYIIKRLKDEAELCHYHGHIRGIAGSWAAISTCNGTSGAMYDGEDIHYLESGPSQEHEEMAPGRGTPHFLYTASDIRANLSCGTEGKSSDLHSRRKRDTTKRAKRDIELTWSNVHGPYNANEKSRYVELVLVVDNEAYNNRGEDVSAFCKKVANIVSRMYSPLNIFIALVGVVIWDQRDEILVTSSSDNLLTLFLEYRHHKLLRDHPNDNAQLLTWKEFDMQVVGKGTKYSICSPKHSGGVIVDHGRPVGVVAHTMAHEMGHNFGMEHDEDDCHCEDKLHCIMAPSVSSTETYTWSHCSLEYLLAAYDRGLDYCLRNKPRRLFQGPVCGNGFVEEREECDCGPASVCDNPCCDSSSCKLRPGAKCATGQCCDLQACDFRTAGTICRPADRECDLPEFCTGSSEYCPDNFFKDNGEECGSGRAFCYLGKCRTHDSQCKLLWGPSVRKGHELCYTHKQECSLTRHKTKCSKRDLLCGVLYCMGAGEDLQFLNTLDTVKVTTNVDAGRKSITCRHVTLEGTDVSDEGLVPNGAKCGHQQMCANQSCVHVDKVRRCTSSCSGRGVCNNLGHCHCRVGFAPPECDSVGPGGSLDSGPATHPDGNIALAFSLYVIFLGIIPLLALVRLGVYFYFQAPKNRSIATTQASGQPIYKPSFFKWRPRNNTRPSRSKGEDKSRHQGGSQRPDISKHQLVSTTNDAVLATLRVDTVHDDVLTASKSAVSSKKSATRIRKMSLTKRLSVALAPAKNPMVRNLLEPSDSSGASTPDTPPALKAGVRQSPLDDSAVPSVAQLTARFRANDQRAASEQSAMPKTSRRPPQPPPQTRKPHFPLA